MGQIMLKQEHLRQLFSTDGLLLEINPCNPVESGSIPWNCNPIVGDIQFGDGLWVSKADYTITLQAPYISGFNGSSGEDDELFQLYGAYLESAQENWNVDYGDGLLYNTSGIINTFNVTHGVSAVGKRIFDTSTNSGNLLDNYEPWMWARDYVNSKLISGFSQAFEDILFSSGTLNVSGLHYYGYNHTRSVATDVLGGSYSVTENWLAAPVGFAIEDFTVTYQTGIDDGLIQVGIEGSVVGLESRTFDPEQIVISKYGYASSYFDTDVQPNLMTRIESILGSGLVNATPISINIGHNRMTGVITYNYSYDNRPPNCVSDSSVRLESITVTDDAATDVFSEILIPGRQNGPLLQPHNTYTSTTRALDIELLMMPVSGCNVYTFDDTYPTAAGSLETLISGVRPVADQVFLKQDRKSWSPKNGRFSRNIVWVYGDCS
jgi:hypothetical protein